ncbi:hypothetical protein GCM10029963_61940 [Micromonospora andamanensis]|uniref:hypothetical protein n=1 Tax=Micromonospora andamanensis TaxID=1287068 RepID=UPI00194F4978|nr:hypothetical protein [Micromonospora andamanensis]GIJ41599.1 hypothetical protein Vwe01_49240 [Micromonospora andamanensis]
MARHRAPVDDPRTREEGIAAATPGPATQLSWPAPRRDRSDHWPGPARREPVPPRPEPGLSRSEPRAPMPGPRPSGDLPPPRRDRFPNSSGVLARPSVVGVARVPVTSRLTPPGRELRNQGPRPVPAGRPVGVPVRGGRHRRGAEHDR